MTKIPAPHYKNDHAYSVIYKKGCEAYSVLAITLLRWPEPGWDSEG